MIFKDILKLVLILEMEKREIEKRKFDFNKNHDKR
jgi:hypothetical protein